MMGKWSDDSAWWVVYYVRLYSVLFGDDVWCSVVYILNFCCGVIKNMLNMNQYNMGNSNLSITISITYIINIAHIVL